jgi:hypothetical protein
MRNPRIRFRGEVNNMQRPVIRLLDALPHDLAVLAEAEVERVYLAHAVDRASRIKALGDTRSLSSLPVSDTLRTLRL